MYTYNYICRTTFSQTEYGEDTINIQLYLVTYFFFSLLEMNLYFAVQKQSEEYIVLWVL